MGMNEAIQHLRVLTAAIALGIAGSALAQSPAATSPAVPSPAAAARDVTASPTAMQQFDWLHGCWDGKVNLRDFREEWLPLRSDIMVGASQTVMSGKSQDFEYLRLELRADGVYYVAVQSGKGETAFHLAGKTVDGDDEIFTFENPGGEFPQRIVYRKGTKGWLYAEVQGTIKGQDHKVIYPMRRVNCQSGELLEN
jgi:Domain of unknown function (DUF6265)